MIIRFSKTFQFFFLRIISNYTCTYLLEMLRSLWVSFSHEDTNLTSWIHCSYSIILYNNIMFSYIRILGGGGVRGERYMYMYMYRQKIYIFEKVS